MVKFADRRYLKIRFLNLQNFINGKSGGRVSSKILDFPTIKEFWATPFIIVGRGRNEAKQKLMQETKALINLYLFLERGCLIRRKSYC